MNSKKMFYIMAGATGFTGLLLILSLVVGNQFLQKRSDKLVSLKLDNKVLDEQDGAITQANKDIEKYKDLLAVAKTIVPQDKDQAKTIREIVDIADSTGVDITSFTFNTSNLGQTTKTVVTPDTPPSAVIIPPPSQAEAVTGMNGVYAVPIDVQSGRDCSYTQFINFLAKLEQKRRTAQVTKIDITPNTKNPNLLKFQLTISVFIKP